MISFSSVSKKFLPDEFALEDVSFTVASGDLAIITGSSGSGKTTLMRLLTKEQEPSSGEILFNDVPLTDIRTSQVHHHRRKIGIVFQDYKLIPELNAWENIALPLSIMGKKQHEIEERVTDLLTLVSLTQKAFLFPSQLSGGEAQRISIARALATAPLVLFADEPTGNLDKDNTLHIARLLQKINELGTTVLFATHDHDVLEMFKNSHTIILEKGKVLKESKKEKPSKKKKEAKDSKDQS